MPLKRTNVYADPADLALIKESVARRGIPEAEIIREGIHLAAMSTRVWIEPLDWPTFDGSGAEVGSSVGSSGVTKGAGSEPCVVRLAERILPGHLYRVYRRSAPVLPWFARRPACMNAVEVGPRGSPSRSVGRAPGRVPPPGAHFGYQKCVPRVI
jgi:hypothetical protein